MTNLEAADDVGRVIGYSEYACKLLDGTQSLEVIEHILKTPMPSLEVAGRELKRVVKYKTLKRDTPKDIVNLFEKYDVEIEFED